MHFIRPQSTVKRVNDIEHIKKQTSVIGRSHGNALRFHAVCSTLSFEYGFDLTAFGVNRINVLDPGFVVAGNVKKNKQSSVYNEKLGELREKYLQK